VGLSRAWVVVACAIVGPVIARAASSVLEPVMSKRGLLALLVSVFACGGQGSGGPTTDAAASGRPCFSGAMLTDPTLIAAPSLDCPSRMCLHLQGETFDVCTAQCTTPSDCVPSPTAACSTGFACTEVTALGTFGCKKVCVCTSSVPPGGFGVSCP
jgi:hypothetical protein